MNSHRLPETFALLDDADGENRLYSSLLAIHEVRSPADLPRTRHPAVLLAEYEGRFRVMEFATCDRIPADDVDRLLASCDAELGAVRQDTSRDTFIEKVRRVQEYIRDGDTYQVNLSFRLHTTLNGSPAGLYRQLRRNQPVPYGALIRIGGEWILSRSPELFVSNRSGRLTTRPMKGTAARSSDRDDDEARAEWLRSDAKTRAENLMIVDLLRNDLGKVSEVGSVQVTSLFDVEAYPTVWQLTSTITAQLRSGLGLPDTLEALFPCGSITGAPKLRTMALIADLESSPRGLYTGAIGWLEPGGDFCMSVAIRTLVLQEDAAPEGGSYRVVIGVGAGILLDSDPAAEWDECLTKAGFLTM